jgi:Outer membrane protein beta-barrel domain
MSEKGANIDLLFRNGLKDYEVLPPPGVWDSIHSKVKIKSRPLILLRVAAVITVLLTVSFLTYRWSREISSTPSESVLSVNGPVSLPDITVPFDNPKTSVSRKNLQVKNSSDFIAMPADEVTISEEAVADVSPISMLNIRETKDLSIGNSARLSGQRLTPQSYYQVNSAEIKYHDLPYNPENISTKPVNRWSIAAMASPTYYSRINSGGDELSSQLMSSEQQLFSYSGGVSFSYKISKRFSIQSGLYYSSLGQKVDGINSFSGFGQYNTSKGDHSFEVLTATGTVFTSNPDVFLSSNGADRIVTAYTRDVFDPKKASLQPVSSSLSQNFSYLEFPVIVRYKIVDKTIGINLIGGLSYNLLVHNAVTTTFDGNVYPIGDTKGLNPLSLSSSFGMGMEYNLSGKLSLNLEPTFRYYLNPFSVSTGTFMHPYSFGIFSGVSYKF